MALSSFAQSGLSRVVTRQVPWAVVSGAPTGSYTSSGVTYNFWSFTGNGTLTVATSGYIDVVVVGGGGGRGVSTNGVNIGGGGAGGMIYGLFEIASGSHSITIGGAGSGATFIGGVGTRSTLGTILYAGGGGPGCGSWRNNQNGSLSGSQGGGYQGGIIEFDSPAGSVGMGASANQSNRFDGLASSITGSSVVYSVGGHSGNPTNAGSGGWSGAGQAGIVIVRVAV